MPLLEKNGAEFSKDSESLQLSNLPFSEVFLNEREQYRFDEWYPRMGGGCSLNSLYAVELCRHTDGSEYGFESYNNRNKVNNTDTTQMSIFRIASKESKACMVTWWSYIHGVVLPRNVAFAQDISPEDEHRHLLKYLNFCATAKMYHDADVPAQFTDVSMEDLPDVVLVEIFRFLHPIERVHSASLVCKRWNRLLYVPNVWREVRVVLSPYSIENGSAKKFLARIASNVQKLCLCLTEGERGYPKASEVEDVLPHLLPQLNLLDIGYFPGLTAALLWKMDRCMPNLQRLNMEHAFSASCYEILFSERALVNVRELILCGWGFTAHKIETLFHVKSKLEVLNADEASNTTGMHSRNWKGFDEVVIQSPLKRLYVRGFFRPYTLLRELQNFCNLTLLSFSYAGYMGPEDILPIKRLSRLEHLHLSGNYDDYSRMTAECLRVVFGPAESETDFPSRLKFLSLPDWLQLDDSVIEEIAQNCEQLRSLSIARCHLVTQHGFFVIAKSLRRLRFLDINELVDTFGGSALCGVGDDDLPHLVYLSAHSKRSSYSSEGLRCSLQRLMVHKPTLILSDAVNSFITYNLHNGQTYFNDTFVGNVGKIANELGRIEGFCCMSRVV